LGRRKINDFYVVEGGDLPPKVHIKIWRARTDRDKIKIAEENGFKLIKLKALLLPLLWGVGYGLTVLSIELLYMIHIVT